MRWALLGVLAWVTLSAVLFMVSAQIQRGDLARRLGEELAPAPFPLFGANTILVLGSDARTEELAEPGATVGGPSRSDSIMLLRIGGGANASLSIPRDTVVDIPGSGTSKINAAYAIGGARLATRTVKQFLGVEVNHVVEVSFENFPQLVDALGGITVRTGCVISRINGGTSNGGYTLRLRRGEHELDGEQALALARTRKNDCRPAEDDRTRARRQQQIVAAMKDKVTSFETFVRLPWVSWAAPQRRAHRHERADAARRRRRLADGREPDPDRAAPVRRGDAGRRRGRPDRRRRDEGARRGALPAGMKRFARRRRGGHPPARADLGVSSVVVVADEQAAAAGRRPSARRPGRRCGGSSPRR